MGNVLELLPPSSVSRVLIVEDEPLIARHLRRALEGKHEVSVATNGEEALALFERGERFSLILCDLQMPCMTVVDFLMNLDLIDPDQVDRIVFLTANPSHPMARLITENLVLEKPFDPAFVSKLAATRAATG
jgi:CheY-like chemotaxis protein